MDTLPLDTQVIERLEELVERVERIEDERATIASKSEVVRGAELNWRAIAAIRDRVVFSNDAGDTVSLARGFLVVIAARDQLDASDVVEDEDDIVFLDGETELERVPKTLWVRLPKVLEQCSWFPGRL